MRSFLLLVVAAFSTACASPIGRVTRFESHGQVTLCWEPSAKLNGLTEFIANRVEAK